MKYTYIDSVQQGDKLGKDIYASDGRVLLHQGVSLTIALLSRLRHMGVQALYIKDDRIEDVELEEVVSESTRRKAIVTLKDSFQLIQKGKSLDVKAVQESVSSIIDEVLLNQSTLLNLTDIRTEDNALFLHSVNVGILSAILGVKVGLDRGKIHELVTGALLHDLGKVLPDEDAEPGQSHHTWKGFNALRKQKEISTLSAHIALTHHEYIDGTGEPRQMVDKDIHLFSKIVSVANTYDKLLHPSNGEMGMHPYEACEHIMGLSDRQFSHQVVWRFLRAVAFYPTGSQVKLSTGETGIVVGQHSGLPQRPIVRTFKMIGSQADDYEISQVDLAKEMTVFIDSILTN
ncbi:HD-GYP domain-containing protein [Halalkalibacterium ligniniphilum]|uniref:HD-GYP domain-containing protein n=1 Tax=Halalkalibacterium ligniniphilum TaxID=1134413 RepID=UPI0003499558|nr:HD domain-containing phosphohydrolase [Halalkalibacterium ligniniphilum]